jgi:hypothetical protein
MLQLQIALQSGGRAEEPAPAMALQFSAVSKLVLKDGANSKAG